MHQEEKAIDVRGVSKRYYLGQVRRNTNLREVIANLGRRLREAKQETYWALEDVSFSVPRGSVIGLIGSNGAGKSTLLKVMSRIVAPTTGRVTVLGRVASLLELGTGFHPELTGRENIYLNGAVLGMKRSEVDRRFNEIVDYSGVGEFIETPVKHYSSGMYVRLGFAVAAHLDPDVLLVDEVLAVGDAQFQRKCIDTMASFGERGRTVVFVSHSLPLVERLCSHCILMEHGRVKMVGTTGDVIQAYLRNSGTGGADLETLPRGPGLRPVIQRLEILDSSGVPVSKLRPFQNARIRIHYSGGAPMRDVHFGVLFEDGLGRPLFVLQSTVQSSTFTEVRATGYVECEVDSVPLAPGTYALSPGCRNAGEQIDYLSRAMELEVVPGTAFESGRLPPKNGGPFLVKARWRTDVDVTTAEGG